MKNSDIKKIIAQLVIQDCTAREIHFPKREASDLPSVGDYATDANGVPLDGLVLLPEGDLWKFNKGNLIEILVDDKLAAKFKKLSRQTAEEIKATFEIDAEKITNNLKLERQKIERLLGIHK